MEQEVCIVGGGVLGILAAKKCLDQNLVPFVIEKSPDIGGLWNSSAKGIAAWNSLHANTTKYLLTISDHLWPEESPEFPSKFDYLSYLRSYASKHNLHQYFHFDTTVTLISKLDGKYEVRYVADGELKIRLFNRVIVACGLLSKHKPNPKGFERFKGQIIHSGSYKEPSVFTDKDVVVAGNGFSSGDIAYEALETAKSVTLLYKRTHVYIKRKVNGIATEIYGNNILLKDAPIPILTNLFCNANFVNEVMKSCGNPGDLLEDWRIHDHEIGNKYFTGSIQLDGFYESVQNGRIKCVKGTIKELLEESVLLEDTQNVHADCLVLGIGYYTDFSFLSEEIKQIINFDENRLRFSYLSYRSMIHPELPGFAFAGYLHSIFPGIYELCADVCANWVSGNLNVSQEELWEGIELERTHRHLLDETPWTYEPIGTLKEMLRLLNLKVDYEALAKLGYGKGSYSAVFYYQDRPGQQAIIEEFIRQVKNAYPSYFNS